MERDIPNLGIRIPAPSMRRFWQMLAHYQGQLINYSELGRSFGANDKTIRNYLDILTETFMVRQLPSRSHGFIQTDAIFFKEKPYQFLS